MSLSNLLPTSPVVRVVDLWKEYREDGQIVTQALRGASLEVAPGEVVALFGKSGSGKTTLLNMLAGLDRPTRGRIEIGGRNLEDLGESGRTELRRSRLSFVFQFFNLLPTLTAFENVYLALELAGRLDPGAARAALEKVGLQGKEGRYPHELSGGEQQRVAIARAFVNRPMLLIADEPTGNLDPGTSIGIMKLLDRINKLGTTVVMSTHDSQIVDQMRRRVIELDSGHVVRDQSRGVYGYAR